MLLKDDKIQKQSETKAITITSTKPMNRAKVQ